MPVFTCITNGKTADVNVARTLRLPKGSIVALDKGYVLDRRRPDKPVNLGPKPSSVAA